MSGFLWFGSGATAVTSVLYLMLGLRKPARLEHLCFSLLMAVLSAFFLVQIYFYRSTEVAQMIEIVRVQMCMILAFFVLFAVFICLYADWRPPRIWIWVYGAWVAGLLIYNLVSPYSLYYSELPKIIELNPFGIEAIRMLAAPADPAIFLLLVHNFVVAAGSLIILVRECPGKWFIASGLVVGICSMLLDFANDFVQGGWPYTSEFGAAMWGIFVSLELARDVRRQETQLNDAMRSALVVRDQLNTPLQTLTLGLNLVEGNTQEQKETIERLKRAVARLTELGQSLRRKKPD